MDNLNNALDSVVELVPKLRLIQQFLKKAQQLETCSKRESLTSLYQAQEAIKALQNELDKHKIEVTSHYFKQIRISYSRERICVLEVQFMC